jgi:hypothetical protein
MKRSVILCGVSIRLFYFTFAISLSSLTPSGERSRPKSRRGDEMRISFEATGNHKNAQDFAGNEGSFVSVLLQSFISGNIKEMKNL